MRGCSVSSALFRPKFTGFGTLGYIFHIEICDTQLLLIFVYIIFVAFPKTTILLITELTETAVIGSNTDTLADFIDEIRAEISRARALCETYKYESIFQPTLRLSSPIWPPAEKVDNFYNFIFIAWLGDLLNMIWIDYACRLFSLYQIDVNFVTLDDALGQIGRVEQIRTKIQK